MITRLQKKCLIAATGLHALLLSAAIFGTGFFGRDKKVPSDNTIEIITFSAKPTDGITRGGGNPNVTEIPRQATPPPAAQQAPPEEAAPPPPADPPPTAKSQPVEEDETPDPPAIKPAPPEKQTREQAKPVQKDDGDEPVVKPKSSAIKPNLTARTPTSTKNTGKTPVKTGQSQVKVDLSQKTKTGTGRPVVNTNNRTYGDGRPDSTGTAQRTAALGDLAKTIGKAGGVINGSTSGSTSVEMPGGGGEAFANYSSIVKAMYDRAWLDPEEVNDNNANVRAEITISSSGQVLSTRVVSRSGIGPMDRSVQRALDRVQFIAPFPAGSKDRQRTFILNFNLKSKRLLG